MTQYSNAELDDAVVGKRLFGLSHNGEDPLDERLGRLETDSLRSDPPTISAVERLDDGSVVISLGSGTDHQMGVGVDGWAEVRP